MSYPDTPITEVELLAAQRLRLINPRYMPQLAGGWADELVRLLNAKNLAQLPMPGYLSVEVVEAVLAIDRSKLTTLFWILNKTCRECTSFDEAQKRWAHELTCLAALKSLDLDHWQKQERVLGQSGSRHAQVFNVPTSSALVAGVGLSQLMGFRLAWGGQAASRSVVDLSKALVTTNPVNAVLTALHDELDRLNGKPLHPDPDRALSTEELGSLRHHMDEQREEGTLAAIYLSVPEGVAQTNALTLLSSVANALNAPVVGGRTTHDERLVLCDSQLTVETLKIKLDEIFASLAVFVQASMGKGLEQSAGKSSVVPMITKAAAQVPQPELEYHWDVFISHASEDKAGFVEPMVKGLQAVGLKVWYDAQEIGLGESITGKISEGLAQSRFAVVVLSPDFVRKGKWVDAELNAMLASDIATGQKRLLPVCKGLSLEELRRSQPLLADKLLIMADAGQPAVIAAILTAIQARR